MIGSIRRSASITSSSSARPHLRQPDPTLRLATLADWFPDPPPGASSNVRRRPRRAGLPE
jgi:hypothetical protein